VELREDEPQGVARERFLLGKARVDPETASVAVMPFEFLDDEPPQLKPIRRRPATGGDGGRWTLSASTGRAVERQARRRPPGAHQDL
jgi:hypothetical protein